MKILVLLELSVAVNMVDHGVLNWRAVWASEEMLLNGLDVGCQIHFILWATFGPV